MEDENEVVEKKFVSSLRAPDILTISVLGLKHCLEHF
jgi:hypothetical protein